MSSGKLLLVIVAAASLAGCATYVTPGGSVNLAGVQSPEIRDIMARQPAAEFPARLSFARIQSAYYSSGTATTYGGGAFSIVMNRELMTDAHMDAISGWRGVREIAPINRLLIPEYLRSVDDLRTASASLRTDVLIVFTLDTSFRIDGKSIGPLSVVSLGLMRDRETVVSTTASAMLVDVRTGFVYGVAEASASETKTTSAWGTTNAVDQGRLVTEQEAFEGLLTEIEKTWSNIVEEHRSA